MTARRLTEHATPGGDLISAKVSRRARVVSAVTPAVVLISMLLVVAPSAEAADPPDFLVTSFFSGLSSPTVMAFSPDGRVFLGEKQGVIKVFDGLSDTTPTVFADLSNEVLATPGDRGLLGLALAPTFPADPSVFALYTRDALPGGTAPEWHDACPNPPGSDTDGCVATSRLVKLTASGNVATGTQTLITDWCQQFNSHSTGTLAFGRDGYLYVGGGEGASYTSPDYGQFGGSLPGTPTESNPCGDPPGGAGVALSPPSAEGGALRAQDASTPDDATGLDGTIIRIDPDTGDAAPGNPMMSSADPNARRIVAYGMRNPFRFTMRPGTDEIWIGDVGWKRWEEIDRLVNPTAGATNFGWPCYEGTAKQPEYQALGLSLCSDLYAANSARAPYYTYDHGDLLAPGDTCATSAGSSISGIAFYEGGDYPARYKDALFFADSTRGCIYAMLAGSNGLPDPTKVESFVSSGIRGTDLKIGPGGDLFVVDYAAGDIKRIVSTVVNTPPTAVLQATPTSGSAPLDVEFDGSGSNDPDAGDTPLSYAWDLDGDGQFDDSTVARPAFTYDQPGAYTARLRVTDQRGATGSATQEIRVDAEAPTVNITSPSRTLKWKVGETISFSAVATTSSGDPLPPSVMDWTIVQTHCPTSPDACHTHALGSFPGTNAGSIDAPNHDTPTWIEFRVTATDPVSRLTDTDTVRVDPMEVALTLESDPAGLTLSTGDQTGPAPQNRTVIVGSTNTVTAPSPQSLGGELYGFSGWSDGGAGSHVVTAPPSDLTLTAHFVPVGAVNLLSLSQATVEPGSVGLGAGYGVESVSRSTVVAAEGVASLAVSAGVSGGMAARTSVGSVSAAPGTVFSGSVEARAGAGAAAVSRGFAQLRFWNASGSQVGSALNGPSVLLSRSAWTRLAVSGATAPAGAVSVSVFLVVEPSSGEVYYGDKWGLWQAAVAPTWAAPPGGVPVDVTAPSVPAGLVASGGAPGSGQVGLVWSASTDDVGVTEYRVFRGTSPGVSVGGVPVATVTATSWADAGLVAGTYYYRVVAADAVGNASGGSNEAVATVTGVPVGPVNLLSLSQATVEPGSVGLGAGYGVESVSRSTVVAAEGVASLAVSAGVSGGMAARTSVGSVSAAPGTVFSGSVEARAGAGAAAVSRGFAQLRFWNASGSQVGSALNGPSVLLSRSAWTRLAVSGATAPAGAVSVSVFLVVEPSSGEVYYGDKWGLWQAAVAPTWAAPPGGVPVDVTAPSVPAGLVASGGAPGSGQVGLVWSASTDDVGVTEYRVFRGTSPGVSVGGVPVATVTATSWADAGLVAGTYYYRVVAADAVGNASGGSNEAVATVTGVPVDVTAPSVPAGLVASGGAPGSGQVGLVWSASTDDVGVTEYRVFRGTSPGVSVGGVPVATVTATSWADAGLVAGTYYYRVVAADAVGNASGGSNEAVATVTGVPVGPVNLLSLSQATVEPGSVGLGAGYGVESVSRSTVVAAEGVASLAVSAGVSGGMAARTSVGSVSAAPGTVFSGSVEARAGAGAAAVSRGFAQLRFWNASGSQVGSALNGPSVLLSRSAWTRLAVSGATAPAGAVSVSVFLVVEPSSGEVYYGDKWGLWQAAVAPTWAAPPGGVPVDVTAPSVPAGLVASGGAPGSGQVGLVWSASTDDVGVTEYRVFRGTSPGVSVGGVPVATVTATSWADAGLVAGTYYYRVVAADAVGNASGGSNEAVATVTGVPVGPVNLLSLSQATVEPGSVGLGAGYGVESVSRSTVVAAEGVASLAVSAGVSGGMAARTSVGSVSAAPGTVFSGSVEARAGAGAAAVSRGFAQLRFWNASGSQVGSALNGPSVLLSRSAWTRLAVSGATAPAGAVSVSVFLVVEPSSGEVYYGDKWGLWQAAVAPPWAAP